jgi:hypothetical protein
MSNEATDVAARGHGQPELGLQTSEAPTTTTSRSASIPGRRWRVAGHREQRKYARGRSARPSTPSRPATRRTPTGFTLNVPAGTSPTFTVIVTGVDDALVDGNQLYAISVTPRLPGLVIPNVMVTNNDNDQPGITFSKTAGGHQRVGDAGRLHGLAQHAALRRSRCR